MAEFPDANSGGLDPLGQSLHRRDVPFYRLALAWAIVLALAAGAGVWLFVAFRPGHSLDARIHSVLGSVTLIALCMTSIRSIIKAKRSRNRGQFSSGVAGRRPVRRSRIVRAPDVISLVNDALQWAGYTVMQPSSQGLKKTAAWIAILLIGTTMLTFTLLDIAMIVTGLTALPKGALVSATGAVAFVWPFAAFRSLVRGIRAGRLTAAPLEFKDFRARRAPQIEEDQMPLQSKLLNCAFLLAIFGLWWMHALRHPGLQGNWIAPALWMATLAYSIGILLRRPRGPEAESRR